MALIILRGLFVMVSLGIAVLMFGSEGIRNYPSWVPFAVLLAMIAIPAAVIGLDTWIKRKDLTVITAVYFGMLVGIFLTYVAILALTPILPTGPNRWPIVDWLPMILGMILCYSCVSLLLQTRNDFRFLIPYVEFARDVQGMRPNLLDATAIIDGRIADLAEAGVFESRFVVPSFVVDELQSAAESTDKQRRLRGRRGLDILTRLRARESIDVEVLTPDNEVAAEGSDDARAVAMARRLGGRIITNDPNLVKIAALRSVQAINVNDVAMALKPTYVPGDSFHVRLVKPGEEAGQAVGYLEDGTMVVVEGSRDQIGRTVPVSVTSTLQTTAGRLVFARPEASRA
ncbi:MAG: PIN/TRAM domain-containing protein [Planctomycetota bacterium]